MITAGINLSYDRHTLCFVPLDAQAEKASAFNIGKAVDTVNAVSYKNVFGEGTALNYTQAFSGFKEDIILNKRQARNTFSFTVYTNDSTVVVQEDGSVVVSHGGKVWGTFGEVVAYDSRNVTVRGGILVSEVIRGKEYTVTLSVPADFLHGADTVYPVVIDPSFWVLPESGAANLEDMTLFSANPFNHGSSGSLYIGNTDLLTSYSSDNYGTARTYIKFSGMDTHSTFNTYYNTGRVTDIKLNFADVDCGSNLTIAAYLCTANWTENGTMYENGVWNAYSTAAGTSQVAVSAQATENRYELDIKKFVDWWRNGNSPNYGIVLKAYAESSRAVVIGSSESGGTDTWPYITVTYRTTPSSTMPTPVANGMYQFSNSVTTNVLTYVTALTAKAPTPAWKSQRYELISAGSGMYYIEMQHPDIMGKRLSFNGTGLSAAAADSTAINAKWYIIAAGNGGYRIHSAYDSSYVLANTSGQTVKAQKSMINSIWKLKMLCLDVLFFQQQETDTCSAASIRMLLSYYGVSVSEQEYMTTAGGDYAVIYRMTEMINGYISGTSYNFTDLGNYTEYQFRYLLNDNINNSHPMIIGIAILDESDPYFEYTSDGHYVVITGAFYDSEEGACKVVLNDPHFEHSAEYILPVSALLSYCKAGENKHIIRVEE